MVLVLSRTGVSRALVARRADAIEVDNDGSIRIHGYVGSLMSCEIRGLSVSRKVKPQDVRIGE